MDNYEKHFQVHSATLYHFNYIIQVFCFQLITIPLYVITIPLRKISQPPPPFDRSFENDFRVAVAIALFTGLRPNELATAKIQGDFIVAINSKRKNGKIEHKRIPIINALRPYIENGITKLPTPQLIRRRITAVLPNHKKARILDAHSSLFRRYAPYCLNQKMQEIA